MSNLGYLGARELAYRAGRAEGAQRGGQQRFQNLLNVLGLYQGERVSGPSQVQRRREQERLEKRQDTIRQLQRKEQLEDLEAQREQQRELLGERLGATETIAARRHEDVLAALAQRGEQFGERLGETREEAERRQARSEALESGRAGRAAVTAAEAERAHKATEALRRAEEAGRKAGREATEAGRVETRAETKRANLSREAISAAGLAIRQETAKTLAAWREQVARDRNERFDRNEYARAYAEADYNISSSSIFDKTFSGWTENTEAGRQKAAERARAVASEADRIMEAYRSQRAPGATQPPGPAPGTSAPPLAPPRSPQAPPGPIGRSQDPTTIAEEALALKSPDDLRAAISEMMDNPQIFTAIGIDVDRIVGRYAT